MSCGRPLRVLFVSAQTELGGAEISLLTALAAADRARLAPLVATLGLGQGDFPERLRAAGVETAELRAGRPRNPVSWARTVLALRRLARERGCRVVVSNGYVAHAWAGAAARLSGLHRSLFCRDFPRLARPVPAVQRLAFLWGADIYLAASRAVAEAVRRRVGEAPRVVVVPNGVEGARFQVPPGAAAELRARLGFGPGHLVVAAVGRLQRWKGQHVFLEAAVAVAREVPEARFLVVGGALFGQEPRYPEELRALAGRLGLAERTVFAGHQPDVAPYYAASDLVVQCPVEPEPFGRVILEAMAAGRPVVAARAGGAAELFAEGATGLGHEPGNAAQLGDLVVKLCRDPELRERLGRAGREVACRDYTPAASAEALTRALETLAGLD